jgi:hypothetical protein
MTNYEASCYVIFLQFSLLLLMSKYFSHYSFHVLCIPILPAELRTKYRPDINNRQKPGDFSHPNANATIIKLKVKLPCA